MFINSTKCKQELPILSITRNVTIFLNCNYPLKLNESEYVGPAPSLHSEIMFYMRFMHNKYP